MGLRNPPKVRRGKWGSRWRRKNKQKSNLPWGGAGRGYMGSEFLSNELGMLKGTLISELLWVPLDEVHEKMAKFNRAP